MKLIFTKDETKNMIAAHIAKEFGIDTTNRDMKLDFSSYDNKAYCTVEIGDVKPEQVAEDDLSNNETIDLYGTGLPRNTEPIMGTEI